MKNFNVLRILLVIISFMSFAGLSMNESEEVKEFNAKFNPYLVREPIPRQKELKAKRIEMLQNDRHETYWHDDHAPRGGEANCEYTTLGVDPTHCYDCYDYKQLNDAIDYNYKKQTWSEWWNENEEPETKADMDDCQKGMPRKMKSLREIESEYNNEIRLNYRASLTEEERNKFDAYQKNK